MKQQIHNRKLRIAAKRADVMKSVTATIEAIAERRVDAYEGWQQVCGIFQRNAGLHLLELKRFVQIEGVDPNSNLSVTEDLRETIRRNAVEFLGNC
jgi:hypothetical protein